MKFFLLTSFFLLQGCGIIAYVGYLTSWNGGTYPFEDKPCPDCKYTYDIQTGIHERKQP